jgi:GT2 family glycosyltransferase
MKKKSNNIEGLVSIITINYNNPEMTCDLIYSIKKSEYKHYEIIVVDNGSTKGHTTKIKKLFPDVNLILSKKNLGFSGGNNLGIENARGEYIFLLNNDTIILPNSLKVLVEKLKNNKSIGAASPKIKYYYKPNIIQYAGSTAINTFTLRNRHLGNGIEDNGQFDNEHYTNYAHGAAMIFRKTIIKRVGKMPDIYFLYYEEMDWCEKIKSAGFKIRYIPSSVVYHKESMSTGKDSPLKIYYLNRNRILYARRNLKGLQLLTSILYLVLISIPKNTISFLGDLKKLKAYYQSIIWNLTNKININYKPYSL